MKRQFFVGLATLGVAAIFLTSCGDVPQEEIDKTNAAIEDAKAVGADVYATEAFLALQDSMKSTMEGIEVQKSKFFGNFTASKEQLAAIAQQAVEVKTQTEARKEELKAQIQATVTEVKELIAANRQLILEAPKGKEGTTALQAIEGELTTIEASVAETSSLVESGDYQAGLDKANAAKEKVAAINAELQEVIAKYQAKKG